MLKSGSDYVRVPCYMFLSVTVVTAGNRLSWCHLIQSRLGLLFDSIAAYSQLWVSAEHNGWSQCYGTRVGGLGTSNQNAQNIQSFLVFLLVFFLNCDLHASISTSSTLTQLWSSCIMLLPVDSKQTERQNVQSLPSFKWIKNVIMYQYIV